MQWNAIFLLLALSAATAAASGSTSGWCEYNVPMQKPAATSLWQKAKKVFKKTEPNMQLIRQCCVGYKLNEQKECEAVCEQECDIHATCIAPNKCQCRHGFAKDVHGACKPLCMQDCDCAPDHCACIDGECQLVQRAMKATTPPEQTSELPQESPNEEEQTSIIFNEESTTHTVPNMPAEAFDGDCAQLGCHEHAYCASNGSCVCQPGFTLFHATLVSNEDTRIVSTTETITLDDTTTETTDATTITSYTTETLCLSAADLSERLNSLAATPVDNSASSANSQLPLLIALGCIATCFVLFLVTACTIRQRRRHQGKLDVEAKNELCCEYDNKMASEKPLVY